MTQEPWRGEVARLLEQVAEALRAKGGRRAVLAFGTAIAYLERARSEGDELAGAMLAQARENSKDGPTERFTFQPGELEALSVRPEKK